MAKIGLLNLGSRGPGCQTHTQLPLAPHTRAKAAWPSLPCTDESHAHELNQRKRVSSWEMEARRAEGVREKRNVWVEDGNGSRGERKGVSLHLGEGGREDWPGIGGSLE